MTGKLLALASLFTAACLAQTAALPRHFIVLDPQHSHASAVFENAIPNVSETIHVYAPPGRAVTAFLASLQAFNHRAANPTRWRIESHISPDFLQSMLREPPGNIAVIASRNDLKIRYISSCLRAGQNVLADKPWIIDGKDFPSLEEALQLAKQKHLAFYDGMTERFNVAYQIQRELMRDPDLFGRPLTGTESRPAVELKNVHSLIKFDHGKVNTRPWWFLDIRKQGEAITDVGTHLVDLEMATLFPGQAIDYRRDIKVENATRSPITLTLPEFERLTNDKEWPPELRSYVRDNQLQYFCNNTATYTMRGIYTAISDSWEYESKGALSDTYLVSYRGTRTAIQVEQSSHTNYVPEIDILPNGADGEKAPASVRAALERKLKELSGVYPNLTYREDGPALRLVIPDEVRARNGSTFTQLVQQFLKYVQDPQSMPSWEQPDLLAKYFLTTSAARLADK
jgi:predicted dehydrogenase